LGCGFELLARGVEQDPYLKALQGSLALKRDLNNVVRFPLRVKWYHSFGNFPTMVRDDDDSQNLSAWVVTVEERLNTLESILKLVIQELKKLSLKIDDRNLSDSTYRSGRDP